MQNRHEVQRTQTESEMKEQNTLIKDVYKDMQYNDYLESNITFQYGDTGVNTNRKRI